MRDLVEMSKERLETLAGLESIDQRKLARDYREDRRSWARLSLERSVAGDSLRKTLSLPEPVLFFLFPVKRKIRGKMDR